MQHLNVQKKISLLVSGYGFILVLFYGGILFSNGLYGDLSFIGGSHSIRHRLPDIALLVHLAVGLCLGLAPLQQRFFSILSSLFAFIAISFVIYFNISESILGVGSLVLGLVAVSVLLVFPALSLLFMDIQATRKVSSFSSYNN